MTHSANSASMLLALALLVPMATTAQTVTTNWVSAPQSMRRFGGNIYDTARWPSIEVPQSLIYTIDGRPYAGVPNAPLKIIGRPRLLTQSFVLTFNNFAYNPRDFVFENNWTFKPAFPMHVKALLTDCKTNFSNQGSIVDISRTYDCGLPITELLMVIKTNAAK